MTLFQRIRALKLYKNRSFQIILAVEAFLLVLGIAGLFGKNAVYEYSMQDARANFGVYEDGSVYVDESVGGMGNLVDFCNIALPKGVYNVALHYETDVNIDNMCTVTDDTIGYKMLRTGGDYLYAGLNQTDFQMYLFQDCANMIVHASYCGRGSLSVSGLTISETNALNRMVLFVMVIFFSTINVVYAYLKYDKSFTIAQKHKNVYFGLGMIILFSSLPLLLDFIVSSGDGGFHLMRIEGIKDGLLSGQFPVRIGPKWQTGYGYASSVFYGETLLYVAALFRLIGFSVTTSFRMFMFVLNVIGVLIAYYCFKGMLGDEYIGLLCSALYNLAVYRTFRYYEWGAVGEACALVFLPLIAYGFYRVFTENVDSPGYGRSWIPLCAGFTGLIQSHFLTCELVGIFTIVLCLFQIKKVFRPKTFVVLVKTVIYCVLVCAWFLVPFLDYMLTGDFQVHHISGRMIQSRGLYLAHLLHFFPYNEGHVFFAETGMYKSQPSNLGAPFVVALFLWLGLCFLRKQGSLKKDMIGLGKIATILSLMTMVMSLSAFPWDRIQFLNGITESLVGSLEFPHRFLIISTVTLTIVSGVVAKWFYDTKANKGLMVYAGGMIVLMVICNMLLINDFAHKSTPFPVSNAEMMGTGYVSSGEYLPYGTDTTKLTYGEPEATEGVLIGSYEKEYLSVEMHCQNTANAEGSVTLPMLYYKGYKAYQQNTGQELETFAGENCSVTVKLPANFQGEIAVKFISPWYWRLAEVISVLSFVVFVLSLRVDWNKVNKHRRRAS